MKSKEKLIDAIGMIGDEYIEEAHTAKKRKFTWNRALIYKIAAAAVCVLLAVTILPNVFHSAKSAAGGDAAVYDSGASNAYNGAYYATSDKDTYDEAVYAPAVEEEAYTDYAPNPEPSDPSVDLKQNKKLILTADLEMETQDLDELTKALLEKVSACGGYVQNSSFYTRGESTRIYNAVIRIPADSYPSFIEEIKGSGNTVRYSESVDDITDSYTDTQARLSSLRAQYDKVLEFYDKAEDISDLMSVEQRLSELQYEIEYLEARIKNYDLLVGYSTLNLNVTETKVYTPVQTDFFSRVGRAFLNGWRSFTRGIEDFIIDIVYNIWTILILVAIAYIAFRVYRRVRNRKAK